MLDRIIERWSGQVLIVAGFVALGLAAAGYFRFLPPPFSLPPRFDHVLGMTRLTYTGKLLLLGGVVLLIWGFELTRYFRRERP